MFWFKKKKIIVDAFTNQSGVNTYFPLERASRNLPDWWKQLPKTSKYYQNGIPIETSTMKRCVGFVDLIKNSWTIPMYTDLKIKIEDDGWNCVTAAGLADHRGELQILESHNRDQYGSEFNDYYHFKILVPWLLEDNKGINFLMTGAYWNQTKLFDKCFFSPGVLNFKYQHSINVNFFTKREDKLIDIAAGQPLAYLTPMTDNDIEIRFHLISDEEYKNKIFVSTYASKFVDRYRFNKRIIDEKEKGKCPFGFGR